MSASGETADQMVKMSLQGIEVAAEVALKAGGEATKSIAVMLYAILTDQKKIKGKTSLNALLKSGKELKVFAIRHEDLKTFCDEAKQYGVLYSVLKEKNNTDGICDIMVRAEDASKISRIMDKFELATIDTKAIKQSILSEQAVKEIKPISDDELQKLQQSLLDEKSKKNKRENPLGKPSNEPDTKQRKSVRYELNEIKKKKTNSKGPSKDPVKAVRKAAQKVKKKGKSR